MDRNELIQQWRERHPEAWVLPDSSAFFAAVQELEGQGQMPADEGIRNEYQDLKTEDASGLFTESKNAFKAGVDQAEAKLYGVAEMAGDALGSKTISDWGNEGRKRNEQEAAEEWTPTVKSVDDIRTPKEFAYWLAGIGGNQIPMVGGTIAAGVATTALAPEAGAAALLAPAIIGFTQSQNYGELKDAGGQDAMPLSVANGLIGAAVNTVGPFRTARKMASAAAAAELGAKAAGMSAQQIEKAGLDAAAKVTASFIDQVPNPLMRVALNAAKEGSNNMLLGIAQEASTLATEAISQRNNPDFSIDPAAVRKRLSEAAITGFVSGGPMGGMEQVIKNRYVPKPGESTAAPTPSTYAPAATIKRNVSTGAAPTEVSIDPTVEMPVAKSPTVASTPVAPPVVSPEVANTVPPTSAPVPPIPAAPKPLVQEPAGGAGSAPHVNSGVETAPAPAPAPKLALVTLPEQPSEQPVAKTPTLSEIRAKAQQFRMGETDTPEVLSEVPKIKPPVVEQPKVEAPAPQPVVEAPKVEAPMVVEPTKVGQPVGPNPALKAQMDALVSDAQKAAGWNPNWPFIPMDFANKTFVEGLLADSTLTPEQKSSMFEAARKLGVGTLSEAEVKQAIASKVEPLTVVEPPKPAIDLEVVPPAPAELPKVGAPKPDLPAVRKNEIEPANTVIGFKEAPDSIAHILSKNRAKDEGIDTTRTVAAFLAPDGRFVGIPISKDAYGNPRYLFKPKFTRSERLDAIRNLAWERLPKSIREQLGESRGSDRDIAGAIEERKVGKTDFTRAKYEAWQRAAEELGYFDKTPTHATVEDVAEALGDKNLKPVAAMRFENPVKPGVYDLPYDPVDFALLRTRLKDVAGAKWNEDFGKPRLVKEVTGGDSMDLATKGDAVVQHKSIGENVESAVTPKTKAAMALFEERQKVLEQAKQQLPEQIKQPSLPAPESPVQKAEPVISSIKPVENQIKPIGSLLDKQTILELAEGDDRDGAVTQLSKKYIKSLKSLKDQDLVDGFGDMYREYLSPNAAKQFDLLTQQEKNAAIRLGLSQVETAFDKAGYARRMVPAAERVASGEKINETMNSLLREGAARGIDMVVVGKNGVSAKAIFRDEGGATPLDPSNRTAALVLKNVFEPTQQDVLSTLHEILHDQVKQMPDWLQDVLHDAIDRMPEGDTAFFSRGDADPRLSDGSLSGRTLSNERLIEHLTMHGIDSNTAQNMIGSFWRSVKEHFYRAALWVQKQLLGEENVGGSLAMKYAENLAEQISSGDMSRLKSFADQFNVSTSYGKIARMVTKGDSVYVETVNPRTGNIEYPISTNLDHASVAYNIESKFAAAKEQLLNSGLLERAKAEELLSQALGNPEDLAHRKAATEAEVEQVIAYRVKDAIDTAERTAAKINHLNKTYQKLFEAAKVEHPDWTYEYFLDQHGRIPELESTKEKALKTFEARMEEEIGEKNAGSMINPAIQIDELPENRRGIAEAELLAEIRKHADKVSDQIKTNNEIRQRIEQKEERIRASVSAVDANLHDMKATESFAKDVLRNGLRELAKSLEAVQESEYSRGFEEGVLRGLEKEASRDELRQKYTDKVIQRIDVNGMSLVSTMKSLFDLERAVGYDFEAMPPAEIKDAVLREVQGGYPRGESLKHLVKIGDGPDATVKGTALLTAMITMLKKHSHVTEIMRAQLDRSANGAETLRQLRDVLRESNESKLKQMRDTITKDLKRPGNRLIQKWLNVRDESLAQLKEVERIRDLSGVLERSRNTLIKMQGALEFRRGVSHEFNIHPGAQLLVPSSHDEPSSQLTKPNFTLNMSKENFVKSQEIRDVLRKQDAWLDYNADKPRDAVYYTIKEMNRQLKLALGSDNANETISNMRTGLFYGVGEMLRNTGTQGGALAERMVTKMVGIHQSLRADGFALAKRWERAEETLASRIGRSVADTRNLFFREIGYFMGRRAELPVEEALVAFDAYLRADPEIASLLNKPGVRSALQDYVRLSFENNEWGIRNNLKEGNKVSDDKLRSVNVQTGAEAAQLRNPIERGVTGGTFRQKLSDSIRSLMTTSSARKKLLGDGLSNPFIDADLKLKMNPAEYQKSLNDFFTPDLKSGFLAPLLLNEHGTSLPSPIRADGIETPAAYRHVIEAWKQSGGDLINFSRKLYELSGGSKNESDIDYTSRVVKWVSGVMYKLEADVNPKPDTPGATLGHYAMDSRVSSDYPKQWVDYVPFTTHDNEATAHLIAANAAFGRDLVNLKSTVNAIRQELQQFANELGNTPLEREANRAAHKNEKGWFEKREAAEQMYGKLSQFERRFGNLLDPIRGVTGDDAGAAREFLNLVVSGMISGPKSALSNLLSPADTLAVERSLSAKSVHTIARSYGAAAKYFVNSFARVFGANLLANDTNSKRIIRAGGLDVANKGLTLRDYWAGAKGKGTLADTTVRGRAQSLMRAVRDVVMNASIGKNDNVAGPALRLHLFQYTQQLSNFSVADGLLSRLDDIVRDSSKFYEAHPDKVGQTITAKDLGYSDAKGFNSFKEEAVLHGISIEDLAEKASSRIAKGQDILDDEACRSVINMALGRVVGEGSIASRPLYMQETAVGKSASALTGWSFFKTGQVLRMLRDPNGRKDVMTMLNGIKVITLGMIPTAVAFSYLLDQYDEKLAGKKSNLKGLDEGDFFGALLERTVAVGTFGIAGNLMDTMANVKDGSGNKLLSVDQRVVFLNSVLGLTKTIADLNAMGGFENANYANFYRRVMQSVGMGGAIQYIQLANTIFDNPDIPGFKDEASVTARTNVGNLLRAAGRSQGMEVRQMGGSATPNAMTPWVTNMALAAYSNDPQAFREAYKRAIQVAKEMGKENPEQAVAESFASRNPLKSLFRTPLSTQDYQTLMRVMPEEARSAVRQAVAYFNRYGSMIGAQPYVGSTKETPLAVKQMRAKRLESPLDF